jgi:hypothetical protein
LNTGKGRAAEYNLEHVFLLAVAFQFLELGMTPEKICVLLKSAGDAVVQEVRALIYQGRGSWLTPNKVFVYFDPRGLNDLRDGDFASGKPGLTLGTMADLRSRLSSKPGSATRLAVVDLFQLLSAIISHLAGATETTDAAVIDEVISWAGSR